MEVKYADAKAIADRMKATAGNEPRIPVTIPEEKFYHTTPDGLALCLTVDIIPYGEGPVLASILKMKSPGALADGNKLWHLSVTRMDPDAPTPEEVDFWRRSFFEQEPDIELPPYLKMAAGVNSHHFFWRIA